MRYYTKQWYELMQCQDYTLGMKKLPDGDYSDEAIAALYQKKRQQFIAQEQRCHNAPPVPMEPDDFPAAGLFGDDDLQYIAELAGAAEAPKSAAEFAAFLRAENERAAAAWAHRPPFDAAETGQLFDEIYRGRLRYVLRGFPAWVAEQADKRLLAMDLAPERVYARLHKEALQNRAAFRKIERRAERALSAQRSRLPPELVNGFCFHDAEVLQLQKRGGDYVMLLNMEGAGGFSPYLRVTFAGARSVERERGLRLHVRRGEAGELSSNCRYLYDELYAAEDGGVEVHMLLCTGSLKYLTVRCRDVCFEPQCTPDI